MTTQDLGADVGHGPGIFSAIGTELGENALDALFESSPARSVHTSGAAEVAFVAGLAAVLAVPFSLMVVGCLTLSAFGLVTSIIGLARASRPDVAGGLLASTGLVLCLAALAVVALRYAGIDTAVGDAVVPTLNDWLTALNTLVPAP
jgi:hypothetical protein